MSRTNRSIVIRILLAGALAAALILPATSAQAGAFRDCAEQMQRVSELEVRNTSCDNARTVAHRYDRKIIDGGKFPTDTVHVRGGWTCNGRQTGHETWRVRCTRGDDVVRFYWGV